MPNKKISQLVNKTTILSTDLFPIGDATSGQLYKKTIAELQAAIGGAVISVNGLVGTVVLDTDDVQELTSPTNKYFTDARARGAVSATSPLVFNSSTGVFSMPAATTSVSGHLTSTDWNTFNGKENVLTFSSPLVRTSNTISMPAATTSVNGYLTSTDWNTFNNKQGALTLTVTGSSGASTLVGTTLNIPTYTLAGLGGITASFLSGGTGITYNSGTGVIATTITQYTDALSRASLSFTAGSGGYNSTTGVITIPTNTSQLTNGANFITLGSLSGGTGITYNSSTGAISYSGTVYTDSSIRGLFSESTGISYNSTTGAISSTITQYTDALARSSISLTTSGSSGASTYSSSTGVLNVPTYTLSGLGGQPALSGTGFVKISGTTISYDNSTYLTTASAASTYQTIITNPVTGTGTINYLPKWTSSSALGNSALQEVSGSLGLGIVPSTNDYSTFQISDGGLFASVGTYLHIATNAYFSTTWKYRATSNGARYSQEVGAHVWYTAPSGTAGNAITFTQAMTLTAGGNLGLGTTTPQGGAGSTDRTLSVNSGSGAASFITGLVGDVKYSTLFTSSSIFVLETNASIPMAFNTNSTERMRLFANGNFAIGTSTDSGYKLDVNGTGRFSGQLNVIVSSGTAKLQVGDGSVSGGAYMNLAGVSGGKTWFLASNYNIGGGFEITQSTTNGGTTISSSPIFQLASTGAATFSSSVTAQSGIFGSSGSGSYSLRVINNDQSNVRINIVNTGSGGQEFSIIGGLAGASNAGLSIYDNTNASTRLYINSAGNLGLGTSSPTYKFVVSKGGAEGMEFDAGTLISGRNFLINYNRSTSAYVDFQIDANNLLFGTAGTEKMRITSSGSVGIGTSSPNNYGSTTLTIASTSGVNNGALIVRNSTDGLRGHIYSDGANGLITIGSATNHAVSFVSYDTERGRITNGGNWLLGTTTDNGEKLYISGNVRATGTITANSDIRLKKNLERIENALEKVGQISGYTYDTIYDDRRHGGVIAQEIDEVFPEIVNKGNDGLLGVEYGNISALLIEALKELKEKNTALEARLQALEK